jgi:hypothetical protein
LYWSIERSIEQPASWADFAILVFCQPFRTHVSDIDLRVLLHDPVRHHVEEKCRRRLAIFAASALARTF